MAIALMSASDVFAQAPAAAEGDQWILQWNEPVAYQGTFGTIALPTEAELKDVYIDPSLLHLVAQLEDPSFEVREQANRQLVQSAHERKQLYAILVRETHLTTEQRYRVLAALREHLLNTPRGAVGISMRIIQLQMAGPIEVCVTDLIAGMPAERVLKLNDRITHVDGKLLTMNADLPFLVQSKKPGEKVMLRVKRPKADLDPNVAFDQNNLNNFELLEIELELGSVDMLDTFNDRGMGNQLSMSSRVSTIRQAEADTAARRLAPPARAINVQGAAALAVNSRDLDVEQDPVVQRLLAQRESIERGQYTQEQLRQLPLDWQMAIVDLYQRAQGRNLTLDQQDYLNDVIERVAELTAELQQLQAESTHD